MWQAHRNACVKTACVERTQWCHVGPQRLGWRLTVDCSTLLSSGCGLPDINPGQAAPITLHHLMSEEQHMNTIWSCGCASQACRNHSALRRFAAKRQVHASGHAWIRAVALECMRVLHAASGEVAHIGVQHNLAWSKIAQLCTAAALPVAHIKLLRYQAWQLQCQCTV